MEGPDVETLDSGLDSTHVWGDRMERAVGCVESAVRP